MKKQDPFSVQSPLQRAGRLSRREVLRSMALLSGAPLLAQVPVGAPQIRSRELGGYGDISDYKSLVCVFLNGGNDIFNVFVPNTTAGYQSYANLRQNLAIPKSSLLPIASQAHGFHPSLTDVRDLYDQGKLAVVSGLGNLIEPVTLAQYEASVSGGSPGVDIPPALFSHSDQMHAWLTGRAPQPGQTDSGWGGRMADLLVAANDDLGLPPSFTIAGTNLWQASGSAATQQFALNSESGAQAFDYLDDASWPPWEVGRTAAWEAILATRSAHVLESQASDAIQTAKTRIANIQSALALSEGAIATPFDPLNPLAAQLRMVARIIFAREALGMKRQLFFVTAGAWDTHGTQLGDHAGLLAMLNHALASFYATTVELGVAHQVTSLVGSEFGRTLATNGDGTDHGWGTSHFVLGDAVRGGQIHGPLPSLEPGGPDDAGNATLPQHSTDQFGSTLAKWLGVTASDRKLVFSNVANFPTDDLGFMT